MADVEADAGRRRLRGRPRPARPARRVSTAGWPSAPGRAPRRWRWHARPGARGCAGPPRTSLSPARRLRCRGRRRGRPAGGRAGPWPARRVWRISSRPATRASARPRRSSRRRAGRARRHSSGSARAPRPAVSRVSSSHSASCSTAPDSRSRSAIGGRTARRRRSRARRSCTRCSANEPVGGGTGRSRSPKQDRVDAPDYRRHAGGCLAA